MIFVTHFPCSKINVFAFQYLKANCKEIYEQKAFLLFFQKNADVSFFVEI